LGGLFIYASVGKILNQQAFAKIVYNYKILPDTLVTFVALTLPWLEMVTGIFLVAEIYIRTSAIILSSLLVAFILAISFNLIRGLNFDCGCFTQVSDGSGSDPVGLLIRDILILIPGLIIIFFGSKKPDKL
jgi:uncharacterized membrane protein YphA (DoxX/SURF4 family)